MQCIPHTLSYLWTVRGGFLASCRLACKLRQNGQTKDDESSCILITRRHTTKEGTSVAVVVSSQSKLDLLLFGFILLFAQIAVKPDFQILDYTIHASMSRLRHSNDRLMKPDAVHLERLGKAEQLCLPLLTGIQAVLRTFPIQETSLALSGGGQQTTKALKRSFLSSLHAQYPSGQTPIQVAIACSPSHSTQFHPEKNNFFRLVQCSIMWFYQQVFYYNHI